MSCGDSFSIGLQAVRATRLPMAVLWCLAALVVLLYYGVPAFASALDPLVLWQRKAGYCAAFLNRVIFLGILPGVFLLAMKSIRPRSVWTVILLQTLWCGGWGVLSDALYRLQAAMFGDGRDLMTLACKTAFDQFAFTAFLNAPANAIFFFWLSRDVSWRRVRREFPRDFIRKIILPNLIANWCVAIPVTVAIYALPQALQVQVSGFTSAFWVLACLQIGARSARKI